MAATIPLTAKLKIMQEYPISTNLKCTKLQFARRTVTFRRYMGRQMSTIRLLPMELPSASNIKGTGNGTNDSKLPFLRCLAMGFGLLTVLALLYVPAYHSAQGLLFGNVQIPGWAYDTTRDLRVYIEPENNTTVLGPAGLCTTPPFLLIIICSAVVNQKAREAIRNTWGNRDHLDSTYASAVKVAFLLGQSDNDTLNDVIANESVKYNDIIQEKFHDTYNNLTLKSVMMLKWVLSNCGDAKYLMKTDDDMFVNVPALMKTMKSSPQTNGVLLGSLIRNARPISDPKNKWYTPKYIFSERMYPNYLSGTGYVMSLDVGSKLYDAALATPLIHLEDVYLTGVCARLAKLRPTNHEAFSYVPRKMDPCVFKTVITAHKLTSMKLYDMWNRLNESSSTRNGGIMC